MPVIKSAIKKLRQAEKKTARNRVVRRGFKELIDDFKKKPTSKGWDEVSSALDKAAKNNVLHKNKVARLKSRLAKLVAGSPRATQEKVGKKTTKKKTSKS